MSTRSTPHRPVRRALTWLAVNSAYCGALYVAIFHGSQGFTNLLTAFHWFTLFILSMLFLGSVVRDKMPEDPLASLVGRRRPVPAWLSHGVGLAIIGVLGYHGWWFGTVVMILNELMESHSYNLPPHAYQARPPRRLLSTGYLDNSELFEQMRRERQDIPPPVRELEPVKEPPTNGSKPGRKLRL